MQGAHIIEGEVVEASWSIDTEPSKHDALTQVNRGALTLRAKHAHELTNCPLPYAENRRLTWNEIHGIVMMRSFYAFQIHVDANDYDVLVTRRGPTTNHLITVSDPRSPEVRTYAQCTPGAYESEFWMAVGIAAAQLGG